MVSMLRFMDDKKCRKYLKDPVYRIKLFKPDGQYPEGVYFVPNAFFSSDSDLVFSVTYGASWDHVDDDLPYMEFDWASPNELKLFASLLLCEKRDDAVIIFYPLWYYSPFIDVDSLDLSSMDTVRAVKELLMATSKSAHSKPSDKFVSECICGKYSLISQKCINSHRLQHFWSNIALDNHILFRGIHSLIKSDMLSRHYEFMEEAVIISYVALDASFSLVCQKLISEGVKNPSAKDAAHWLHRHFDKAFNHPEPTMEKYFEEFYDERVRSLHADSRLGTSPYPPISADDFFHLRRAIREIFAFLVTNEHGPDYLQAVEEYRRFNPHQV